ncbi:MAG: hypothetical protein JWL71_3557 [Acidobacteria bacterium]|nr:hypothetical protein [Acidobacteriota bacterium]
MSKSFRQIPALILAAGVALASTACGATVYRSGYPRGDYPPPARGRYISVAAQNGYRDGIEAGRDDARHRERFDPVRARRYRQGDHDYDRRYGSRDEYRREYRSAFEQGYREGYDRGGRR